LLLLGSSFNSSGENNRMRMRD